MFKQIGCQHPGQHGFPVLPGAACEEAGGFSQAVTDDGICFNREPFEDPRHEVSENHLAENHVQRIGLDAISRIGFPSVLPFLPPGSQVPGPQLGLQSGCARIHLRHHVRKVQGQVAPHTQVVVA